MKNSNYYQNIFILKALLYLPHHLLLSIFVKIKFKLGIRLLDILAKLFILKNTKTITFTKIELDSYLETTKNSKYWHGTGKYHYNNGAIIDVLLNIIKAKGLTPKKDVYGVVLNGKITNTVSLSTSRIIARSYSDINGKGKFEVNRYGDALTWVSYYYGLFYAHLYTFDLYKIIKYYKMWHQLSHNIDGHNKWGKKTNKSAKDVWDIFYLGSDIELNFPVLFGINTLDSRLAIDKKYQKYEVRSSKLINLTDFSHIEVPLKKVEEVNILLKNNNIDIPVYSIELGEYAASKQPFSKLLDY